MKLYALIALLVLLVTGGCANTPVTSEDESFRSVAAVWTRQVGHGTEGEQIYAVSYREIMALDRKSGKELWRRQFERSINTGVAIAGEMLLFGGDAEVVAVSKTSGEQLWLAKVNSEVLATPVIADGLVIVRTVDGSLTAHDLNSGKQRWSYQFRVPVLSLRGDAMPVIRGDTLYVGTASGHVIALELHSGELRWDSTLAVAHGRNEIERLIDIDAPLLITKYGIVASAYQQGSMLLTPQAGQIIWKRDYSTTAGAVVDGEQLYFGDLEGNLWSASLTRGASYWKQSLLEGRKLSQPAVQADMVLVGDDQGYVHWFAKSDGSQRFTKRVETSKEQFPIKDSSHDYNKSFNESRAILVAPLVVDDWVYLIDQRGVLEAFRLSR